MKQTCKKSLFIIYKNDYLFSRELHLPDKSFRRVWQIKIKLESDE